MYYRNSFGKYEHMIWMHYTVLIQNMKLCTVASVYNEIGYNEMPHKRNDF